MSKKAGYYEEAKRLFVNEGFSLDTIAELLKGNVSRKTLFNWKNEHGWEEKRKKISSSNESIDTDLLEIVKTAIKEYNTAPSAHNMFAVHKAITSLKMWQGIQPAGVDEEDKGSKVISAETIRKIQKDILGIDE